MSGWIKLHRELTEKSIWTCATLEQRSILITILLLANHQEKEWEWKGKRFKCEPGQFVTSSTKLAKKALVTRQNVRSSLVKFKKYEFLTYESTKTGLLITVINWAKYQSCDNEPTNQVTIAQPTGNQQVTTNKNDKNDKKSIYADKVAMTEAEYQKLIERFGEGDAKKRIERLSVYKLSKGKNYKSDYHTIIMWASKDEDKQKPAPPSPTKNIL